MKGCKQRLHILRQEVSGSHCKQAAAEHDHEHQVTVRDHYYFDVEGVDNEVLWAFTDFHLHQSSARVRFVVKVW